jgi:lysozyme
LIISTLIFIFSFSQIEKTPHQISDIGLAFIKSQEGYSDYPYTCLAGTVAIGYGSTTYENGKPVLLSDPPVTEAVADRLFRKKIHKYEKWVNKLVKTDINQNQFDALVSLSYNIGFGSIKRSQLLKLVNVNPNDPQIATEFLKWRKANGKVTKGLETRRQKEVELYFK